MNLKVQRCIRLDHTFKVATNIGYLRPDGKWVNQYGSVFLVLNERGQVLAWQLTNSTSLEEVKPLLCGLKERLDIAADDNLIAYVDNCCQVRKQLQKICGGKVTVKLDVFHAVQRITRAMSKRHVFFHTCVHDLRMVFRHLSNVGKKRTENTPTTSQMLTNMATKQMENC